MADDTGPITVNEFADLLIAERGGRDRFSAVQIRVAAAVAVALRDPSQIDPAMVSKLIDLLPARIAPPEARVSNEVIFVDGFSYELKRAINACKPDDDVGRVALTMAHDRIAELEGENEGLRKVKDDCMRELSDMRRRLSDLTSGPALVSPPFDPPTPAWHSGLPASEYTPHPQRALPRPNDERHSLAVTGTLGERYPSLRYDPPVS
jgi:hypothetical protein